MKLISPSLLNLVIDDVSIAFPLKEVARKKYCQLVLSILPCQFIFELGSVCSKLVSKTAAATNTKNAQKIIQRKYLENVFAIRSRLVCITNLNNLKLLFKRR